MVNVILESKNIKSIEYTFKILLTDFLGIDCQFTNNYIASCLNIFYGTNPIGFKPEITILPSQLWYEGYMKKASMPALPLKRYRSTELKEIIDEDEVPVIYMNTDEPEPSIREKDNRIIANIDVIASSFFMLSRYEEVVDPVADEYERFPGWASVAFKENFLHRPVVNEYANLLLSWLQQIDPEIRPKQRKFQFFLTHDVDEIFKYPRLVSGYREILSTLIKDRAPFSALRKTILRILVQMRLKPDPGLEEFKCLKGIEEKYKVNSHWYFMAGGTSDRDNCYRLDDVRVKRLCQYLKSFGDKIGYHASYNAGTDKKLLSHEIDVISEFAGGDFGVRCHFLRFKVPLTWKLLAEKGVKYDTSLGFADKIGFRCGTCFSYDPFHLDSNTALDIKEIPLIVMDTTVFDERYEGLSQRTGFQRIKSVIDKCVFFKGNFVLLWHNNCTFDINWSLEDWKYFYESVIKYVVSVSVS